MSLSAIPAALRAATTLVIAAAASARACFTVGRVNDTPTRTSATSGARTTRPTPDTAIVCSGVVVVGATAAAGCGPNDGAAMATTSRAARAPAPSQRARQLGEGDDGGVLVHGGTLLGGTSGGGRSGGPRVPP